MFSGFRRHLSAGAQRCLRVGLVLVLAAMSLAVTARATPAAAAPSCGVLQSGAAAQANAAVLQACALIGTRYVWGGGHDPTPGITKGTCDTDKGAPHDCLYYGLDCSGMVRYAYYLAVGWDIIPGDTYTQWQSPRTVARFSRDQGTAPLLPGDLVFYHNEDYGTHHVAIYIGNGYMVEAPQSDSYVQVNAVLAYGDYYGAIRLFNPDGSTSPNPPPPVDPNLSWVETFSDAPVFTSPTSTSQSGTLHAGTSYVYCKVWGPVVSDGSSFNHYWLKTDPDVGPANQYVSAYYLSRWGNDEAKDNSGTVIRDCPSASPPPTSTALPKYWVDTFMNASVFGSPTSTSATGTLNQGTNYVYCKVWGPVVSDGSSFNHYWLKTDPDVGPATQYVSAYYLSRWGNDEAKDNSGTVIPDCPGSTPPPPPPPPTKYWVDTFSDASVYASPTSTSVTGTLRQGTSYVYCKVWGPVVSDGSSFNHYWLKTDPDEGPANQYVSAYYLSRWGNDEAKDNSGTIIPDC
jgi:cell wall-associated NlpC family hydrolase